MAFHVFGKLLCLLKSRNLNEPPFLTLFLRLLGLLIYCKVRLPLPIAQHLFDEVRCKLRFDRLRRWRLLLAFVVKLYDYLLPCILSNWRRREFNRLLFDLNLLRLV
jgi:hypothetical protein